RELLELRRRAAAGAGAVDAELDAVESLLSQVGWDERRRRLELEARRLLLRTAAQHPAPTKGEIDALCSRVTREPESWEDAYALAVASLWMHEEAARPAAQRALGAARVSGDDTALAWALLA